MTRRAVLVCPGRGTYNKSELGYLARGHSEKTALFAGFDKIRSGAGQVPITVLDAAPRFDPDLHTRGDTASALIYASAIADAQSLADDIEVVGVTGNSMGWYIALAAGGALTADDGFRLVNTMGTLMQAAAIGGQVVYPVVGDDWRPDPAQKARLLEIVAACDAKPGQTLSLSIDLGGMLVLAGDVGGLDAFAKAVPRIAGAYPMRLQNHAAFHTAMQAPVAAKGRAALPGTMFHQPAVPLIDGRGAIWWPGATDPSKLWDYTLGHQVVEPYNFTRAIAVAAREFAPDLFIVTGPGTTVGGAVAQSLIACNWRGLTDKTDFQTRQANDPILIAMGRADQRALAAPA